MSVKNVENFVGNKINYLTIIDNSNTNDTVKVQCDCGVVKDVFKSSLFQKRLVLCGCARNESKYQKAIERNSIHIGKTFNRLTVNGIILEDSTLKFQCTCTCGNKLNSLMADVRNGRKGSCGCLEKDNFKKLGKNLGQYAKENGTFRNYKYNYNINFFNALTPDSAYVLGLLYTDGNLSKNSYRITLGLQEKDKSILERISILLLNEIKLSIKTNQAYEYKSQNIHTLIVSQKEMYENLLTWGLYPKKSLTICPDERLINNRDFWRGCIDGDGTLSFDKNNRFTLGFVGSIQMVTAFKKYCEYILNDTIISNIEKKENIFCFRLDGIKGRLIVENLYKDSNLYIERKYNRYKENFKEDSPSVYRKKTVITYKGKTQTLREWSNELKLGRTAMYKRYHNGCTTEELFEVPYGIKGFKSILNK